MLTQFSATILRTFKEPNSFIGSLSTLNLGSPSWRKGFVWWHLSVGALLLTWSDAMDSKYCGNSQRSKVEFLLSWDLQTALLSRLPSLPSNSTLVGGRNKILSVSLFYMSILPLKTSRITQTRFSLLSCP